MKTNLLSLLLQKIEIFSLCAARICRVTLNFYRPKSSYCHFVPMKTNLLSLMLQKIELFSLCAARICRVTVNLWPP